MTTLNVYRDAVEAALDSARVDRAAPAGEQVAFDPAALDRVVRLFKASEGGRLMRYAWRDAMADTVRAGDMDRWTAVWVLRDRLAGARDRRYVERDREIVAVEPEAGELSPGDTLADDAEDLSWTFPEDYA